MAPLIVLVVVILVARLIGQFAVIHLRDWAASTRVGLAVMFCFTAAAHFNRMRPDMVAMVPPFVPNPPTQSFPVWHFRCSSLVCCGGQGFALIQPGCALQGQSAHFFSF